ncbi:reverse transcriptase-like protein [Sphingomonas sp. AP4-R1]|uniref:reverse transcriptase-like protein n=1 Tax=Sphingomonas sp. AP4-R1 TaxID=2735134 RepID=UPI0014936FF9|nr:reverse transcriptase-like protein [Sphingomonas sp. AP4-R1]QJU59138.1 reverse transcriptase-like protein [Sphingomonas sp. AP4-R1]
MRRDRTTLFFDGGCRPNPGPMEIAAVLRGQAFFRDDLGSGDNNEAEWLALLHALELAIAAGATDALLIGDSTLVIEQASGRWPCRSPHLQPYLEKFRSLAPRIPRLRMRQVPRSRNLAGIALARRGMP